MSPACGQFRCGRYHHTVAITRGFSMIELLMVLGIVTLLFGLALGSLREENLDAAVQAEAERLAAVLRQARDRAIAEEQAVGVTFHIQNAVGTSGAVLNNWDEGHWYQVVRSGSGDHANAGGLPLAGAAHVGRVLQKFQKFEMAVAASLVTDEKYVLPGRKVRFLALSDTDEGGRRNGGNSGTGADQEYTYSALNGAAAARDETTYPRPWFGYYDEAAKKLWPWGGYNPASDLSGFYYEGRDGDVTGSVHPSDRVYNTTLNIDFNDDGDGGDNGDLVDGVVEAEVFLDLNDDGDLEDIVDGVPEGLPAPKIWRQGQPRALVNAAWLDATIMFTPEGRATFMEWCRGRRGYGDFASGNDNRNGVADRAKRKNNGQSYSASLGHMYSNIGVLPTDEGWARDNGGVAHFNRYTGGFYITLGPDALTESNDFGSVEEAMDSIDPAWRVFVSETGTISVMRAQFRRSDAFLDDGETVGIPGGSAFPSDPDWWLDPINRSSTTGIHQNLRTGWLHDTTDKTAPHLSIHDDVTGERVGAPIVDIVSPRMMTDKIWWIKR